MFDTAVGRLGIAICADFAFFTQGVEKLKQDKTDMIFNPALWFALSEAFPATVIGRHMEYALPIIGVNIARPATTRDDSPFPAAGGFTTVCVPPPVKNLDELGAWFRTKSGSIDSMHGFVYTLGAEESILTVDIDIEAVRHFPGYFYTETITRPALAAAHGGAS